ncbi:nitrous oxide reductase accessory protein NosL [Ferrimonas aestuarii]|uniref:Nitrous oxide reductase accessory protein NosL n=1 Tax=Ferrimonas aestuarii TaxID=2569539 RepID=A0A4U1BG67_9GAMM|nr:nitrous oxide reductase accessory protein NosL [Ferrimonas aestuarii]TKB50154.1 nitrous oxide reductase accessory protein NosL [Ferrimonas aestuarii]
MRYLMMLMLAAILGGCGQPQAEPTGLDAQSSDLIIGEQRRCHQCGMFIKRYPGPKAMVRVKGQESALAFCSTGDMFQFVLQPENVRQIKEVWVHDMGKTDWDNPQDHAFMPAEKAWFVTGSNRHGAMGPTLVSFSVQQQAQAFANSYGGSVKPYDEISLNMFGKPSHHGHKH